MVELARRTGGARTALAVVLVGLAGFGAVTGPLTGVVSAQSAAPRTWGVQPVDPVDAPARSSFTYALEPGAKVHDAMRVTNFSAVPLALSLYATDAFNTASGGFDVLARSATPTQVGAWTHLEEDHLTLAAGASAAVPFTVVVPSGAEPGDHAGGIVASLAGEATDAQGHPVHLDQRVGARIYLRVDGPLRPDLEVRHVQIHHEGTLDPIGTGRTTVTYTIANTGNVRLGVAQAVTVQGPLGLGRHRVRPGDLAELLPGSALTVTVPMGRVLPLLRLTARVTLVPRAAQLGPQAASAHTWAVPWTLLALSAAVVAVVTGRWRRRRSRAARSAGPTATDLDPAAPTPVPAP